MSEPFTPLGDSGDFLLSDYKPRVANTNDLRAIAARAQQLDYNRQIPLAELERLSLNGNHILFPMLAHAFAQGQPVPVHIRARVLVHQTHMPHEGLEQWRSIAGNEIPEFFVDVPMDLWESLYTDEQARGILGIDPPAKWNEKWARLWEYMSEGKQRHS